MKLIAVAVAALLLSGCATTTVPVTMPFPDPPGQLAQESCPDLKKLPGQPTLSEVARIVAENYQLYYECAIRADAWNDWYARQRRIYQGANK